MNEQEDRGPWYLFTGLVIGFCLGLFFAWVVWPIQYVDTAPDSLRADFKDQYRLLIASAYAASGDITRARVRLEQLEDADMAQALLAQSQVIEMQSPGSNDSRALALLAAALGDQDTPTPYPTEIPDTPAPTSSPTSVIVIGSGLDATPTPEPSATPQGTLPATSTLTPLPTRTATPTPGNAFVLLSQELICDATQRRPLIQVEVTDAAGQPIPGVEVIVSWQNGEERFFTGLKPELGSGYADYEMTPDVLYAVRLGPGSQIVQGVSAGECETVEAGRFWGAWKLIFKQP